MNWKIIESADGSHTLRSDELNETYHSRHGAVQESMYVFIERGLGQFAPGASLDILEVGFGTGLNAFLTLLYQEGRNIRYTALEPYPVETGLLGMMDHGKVAPTATEAKYFEALHKAAWDHAVEIIPGFSFLKKQVKLQDFVSGQLYDLVYYDAFGFHAQPEMWQEGVWQKLHRAMKPGGIWVSYCAKGEVRRGLQRAGFEVERLPGPPGKREMLRGRSK